MPNDKNRIEYEHIPITGIKRHKEKLAVYNMSVEEDMTYTANGFVVHNCAALHGTVLEDMNAEFDEFQTFGPERRDDGVTPKLKFYGDKRTPPRHPRCRCSIASWRDAWRNGAIITPEKMAQEAREWAEKHGYPPKTFAIHDLGTAQARINDVKAYLQNTAPADMQAKILKAWLEELQGISKGASSAKGLKISASKLAANVSQVLDMVLLRDKADTYKLVSARELEALRDALAAIQVKSKDMVDLRQQFLDLFEQWIKETEEHILTQWDIMQYLAPDYAPSDWYHALAAKHNVAFFLEEGGKDVLTKATKEKVVKVMDESDDFMLKRIAFIWDDAVDGVKAGDYGEWDIEHKISTWKMRLEDLQDDPLMAGIKPKVEELVNNLEGLLEEVKQASLYEKMTAKELAEVMKAKGFPSAAQKYFTKEQKIEALKKGLDDPEVQEWVKEVKKKATEAVKASQAKAKARKKAAQEALTVKEIDPDAHVLASDIPGVYQALVDPKHLQTHTPPAKVVLKNTHGREINFTYKGDARLIYGGQSEKYILLDEYGNEWMFKVYGSGSGGWPGHAEVAANDIMDALGHASVDIRYVEFTLPSGEKKGGSVQRILPKAGDTEYMDPVLLTDAQRRQLQEFQIVDYLLMNLDCHHGNFAIMHDGSLMAWDKGQAFKHLDRVGDGSAYDPDTILSLREYNAYNQPYYVRLWQGFIRGDYDMDLHAIEPFLEKVENLPDSVFTEALKPYLDARFKGDPAGRQKAVETILARKNNIRAKVEEFYRQIAKEKGISFDGFPPKKAVAQTLADDAKAGLYRTVTKQFAEVVDKAEYQGVTYFVGGQAVENNSILVQQVWRKKPNGDLDRRLRLTLKIRNSDYEKNLTDLIRSKLGNSPVTAAGGPRQVDFDIQEGIYEKILGAVKTVDHHNKLGDYAYNQSKIQDMKVAKQKLLDLLAKTKDPEEKAMAQHYLDAIAKVETHMQTGDPYTDIWFKKYLYTPKPKDTPKPQVTAPGNLDITDVREGVTSRYYGYNTTHNGRSVLVLLDERQEFRYSGGGVQYRFRLNGKYDVEYTPNYAKTVQQVAGGDAEYVKASNTLRAKQGLLEVELPWNGTPEEIEEALNDIRRLGIEMHPVTQQDLELSYWRQFVGSVRESAINYDVKDSYEFSDSSLEDTRIKGLLKQLDADLKGITDPKEELDRLKKFVADAFGEDVVKKADWRPKFDPLVNDLDSGLYAGRAYWHRPDVTNDVLEQYTPDGLGLFASVGGGDDTVKFMLETSGYMHSTEERARLGMHVTSYSYGVPPQVRRAGGWSSDQDMNSGGAQYVFTRLGRRGAYSNIGPGSIVLNPRPLKRLSTMTYSTDVYGRPYIRRQARAFDPRTWQRVADYASNNETDIKDSVNLFVDFELYFAESAQGRKEIIDLFKKKGVKEIRGVPIEERVVDDSYLRSKGYYSMMDYYQEFFKKYRRQIFHVD